jgi:hypothetical protein
MLQFLSSQPELSLSIALLLLAAIFILSLYNAITKLAINRAKAAGSLENALIECKRTKQTCWDSK